jgi:hypothetical protein
MLRIHIEEQCHTVTVKLEGTLAGPWVTELDRRWQNTLARCADKRLAIILEAVRFVDGPGELLLREMYRAGATLVGRGPQSRHLEQIQERRAS